MSIIVVSEGPSECRASLAIVHLTIAVMVPLGMIYSPPKVYGGSRSTGPEVLLIDWICNS